MRQGPARGLEAVIEERELEAQIEERELEVETDERDLGCRPAITTGAHTFRARSSRRIGARSSVVSRAVCCLPHRLGQAVQTA